MMSKEPMFSVQIVHVSDLREKFCPGQTTDLKKQKAKIKGQKVIAITVRQLCSFP